MIFYILTKSFTNLGKRYPHFALFEWKSLKAQFIFFILVQKQTFSGRSYSILLKIPPITTQRTIFVLFTGHKINYHLISHILLILMYYVYKTRANGLLDLKVLKRNIHKIKNIEKQISLDKSGKRRILSKNGNHCSKTLRIFFEIYKGATAGWDRGNVFFLYVVIFSTSCDIIAPLKKDA